jgi:hypothetical protein
LIQWLFHTVDALLPSFQPSREEMIWLASGLGALCELVDTALAEAG